MKRLSNILAVLVLIALVLFCVYVLSGCFGGSAYNSNSADETEYTDTFEIDPAEMTGDGYTPIDTAQYHYIDSLIQAGVAIGDTDEGV